MARRFWLSHLCFRFGLGIVFLWIGIDAIRHPEAWIGFVPATLPFGLTRVFALQLGGFLDIALGALFIINTLPKITALLAAAHLGVVLFTQGLDAVLIRDVGLLGTALGLLWWPHSSRRRLLPRLFKRRNYSDPES